MLKQPLHDGWMIRPVGDLSEVPASLRDVNIPGAVPGCVHTALLRAGKIPDPYRDLNEYQLQWIGKTDWEYRTTFDADAALFDHERIDLVFDGLDTVATIELNGSVVGRTQNMFRSFRFDIRKLLRHGSNELRVTLASPVKYAFAMRDKLGSRPWVNGAGGPFNFIRKMACNFGWDWGPVLTTSGIWKGVRVEGWSGVRICEVRPLIVDSSEKSPGVAIDVSVERTGSDRPFEVRSQIAFEEEFWDAQAVAIMALESSRARLSLRVTQPSLWWPKHHGSQQLYHLSVMVRDDRANIIDNGNYAISLRTVELDASPDDIGSKFVLKVNGKPIFCKGFNWIPDDCFLDRACDPARVRKRIQQAVDAGANMLRVWGGGIYETDAFYDICDEMGVMVWQDFPFACAMYPEEEPFKSEVEAEARENVARLASHPSLVIWNGCNENIWAYRDWGWKDHVNVKGKTWGLGYYLELLPRVMKEVDPSRPYWAASPWSRDADADNGIHPNDPNHGNMHVWGPWFKDDYVTYRKYPARFCSEFGFQAPANFATIAGVVPEERAEAPPFSRRGPAAPERTERREAAAAKQEGLSPVPPRDFGSIAMRHRQKSGNVHDDGDLRNLRHLARHFDLPGLEELIASLTVPEPRPPLPAPGVIEPLHTARGPSRCNFDDLHYLLQLNQCRALTLGVEYFRSLHPRNMGTLYWQLNDCWPGVTSWSAIDGDGRLKPLWYATRRFFAPRLLTIQPGGFEYAPGDALTLVAINDSDEAWSEELVASRSTFKGVSVAEQRVRIDVAPRSVQRVALSQSIVAPSTASSEVILVRVVRDTGPRAVQGAESFEHGGFQRTDHQHGPEPRVTGSALWFFAPDKHLQYPPPEFEGDLVREADTYRLTIRARALLRDIIIATDRLDQAATIDQNVVTLLPGESSTFVIHSTRALRQEQLISRPVFQCANWFGATKRNP